MSKKLAIVMTYYNRSTQLLATLESIKKFHSDKNVPIIIVDDGSSVPPDYLDSFQNTLDIRLVTLPKNKWYYNPCIAFNIGFKLVPPNSDIVLIQNAECMHKGDIISHALANLSENEYYSYATYSLSKADSERARLDENISLEGRSVQCDGDSGWYNHSCFRPVGYHFISAIHKKNLDILKGFDERYAEGIAYDDDEFLYRIRNQAKLNVSIIDSPYGMHQFHYYEPRDGRVITSALVEKNRRLVEEVTKKEW